MTPEPRRPDPADLAAVNADDALVERIARGESAPADTDVDAAGLLLADLRGHLDAEYDASGLADADLPVPSRLGRRHTRRGLVVVSGALAAALSVTGVAAAVGGESNPVRRAISDVFGTGTDQQLQDIDRLLARAGSAIATARSAGWMPESRQHDVAALLDRAAALLPSVGADDRVPRQARITALRAALAELDDSPEPEATDHGAGAGEGADDHSGASPGSEDGRHGTAGDTSSSDGTSGSHEGGDTSSSDSQSGSGEDAHDSTSASTSSSGTTGSQPSTGDTSQHDSGGETSGEGGHSTPSPSPSPSGSEDHGGD